MSIPHSNVESVKQSPMNVLRWCLQLDCGHDVWVTAKRRPQRKTVECEKCLQKSKDQR